MLVFWSIVALLIAAALLFVVPPLARRGPGRPTGIAAQRLSLAVHREQLAELDAALQRGDLRPEEHAAERAQIERRVAEDLPAEEEAATPSAPAGSRPARREAIAVAVMLPAVALGVYLLLGQPRSVQVDAAAVAAGAASGPHALSPEQMAAMVDRLAEKLKKNPGDADGWHMLARSYASFGRFADAAAAYDKAAALSPRDAGLLADYADTLAMVQGRSLEGRPGELILAALAVDPNHQKALALAGTAAFNRKDFTGAVGYWQRLQQLLPPQSDAARRIGASVAQAQAAQAAAGPAPTAQAAAPAAAASSAAQATIAGEVRIAEALRSRVPPGATLYVFARAVEGPRMPLAVARGPAGGFPARFALDDGSAMSPQTRLSTQQQVSIGARLSASGSATPQSGDLMGTLSPVKVGSRDVVVVIDGVVP